MQQHGAPLRLIGKQENCFQTLVHSIIGQQLATAAARSIYERFMRACGVGGPCMPAAAHSQASDPLVPALAHKPANACRLSP